MSKVWDFDLFRSNLISNINLSRNFFNKQNLINNFDGKFNFLTFKQFPIKSLLKTDTTMIAPRVASSTINDFDRTQPNCDISQINTVEEPTEIKSTPADVVAAVATSQETTSKLSGKRKHDDSGKETDEANKKVKTDHGEHKKNHSSNKDPDEACKKVKTDEPKKGGNNRSKTSSNKKKRNKSTDSKRTGSKNQGEVHSGKVNDREENVDPKHPVETSSGSKSKKTSESRNDATEERNKSKETSKAEAAGMS